MTKENFMGLFVKLCAAYGKKLDEPQFIVYFQYLSNYDHEALKGAVDRFITSPGSYMPSIGDLIETMTPPGIGPAWEKVVRVAAGGCRRWRELTDIEIATVSAIGGINAIQNADEEGLHFIFNDFKNTFPIMVKRKIKYLSDNERLKDLNMVPETYQFIKKSEEKPLEIAAPLKTMLDQVGKQI